MDSKTFWPVCFVLFKKYTKFLCHSPSETYVSCFVEGNDKAVVLITKHFHFLPFSKWFFASSKGPRFEEAYSLFKFQKKETQI